MNHKNWFIILTAILATLLVTSTMLSGVTPKLQPVEAQIFSRAERNWETSNHDMHSSNYNPQNQINRDNIDFIELKWAYPIPPVSQLGDNIDFGDQPLPPRNQKNEGSLTQPLIVDGIVYFATAYFKVFALNAATGSLIWQYQMVTDLTEKQKTLPIAGAVGHLHAISYQKGWIIFPGIACDIWALDALTGAEAWHIEDTCANLDGNAGLFTSGYQSYPPPIHVDSNTLVYVPGIVDGYTGRGYVRGYDLDTKQLKWTVYTVPPAGPLGTPAREAWGDYLVDNCARWWIQGISSCDIPRDLLRNDWGDLDCVPYFPDNPEGVKNKHPDCVTNSGTGTAWGQMPIDEETGMVYMALSQPTPDWNGTFRPGPNLFSTAILGINVISGELVWAHQSITHDLWDLDCSWNPILGNIGSRKVIFKTCKTGFTHAMDAATGELIWIHKSAAQRDSPYKPFHVNSKLPSSTGTCNDGLSGKIPDAFIGCWDPRERGTLELKWQNYPSDEPFWETGFAGSTDIAWDGDTIYTRVVNSWRWLRIVPLEMTAGTKGIIGREGLPAPEQRGANTTFYAVDSKTGEEKWSYFLEGSHRTGATVSGGMVFLGHSNGDLYVLDKDNGELLYRKHLGQGLSVPPTIGADADGEMRLVQIMAGGGAPGALLAFGLNQIAVDAAMVPDRVVERNIPGPERIVDRVVEVEREVVREVQVPVEVVKEVIKVERVEVEVVREVEVPVEVVRTEEVISPVSYIAIGVGVVLVVVAAILFSRKRA